MDKPVKIALILNSDIAKNPLIYYLSIVVQYERGGETAHFQSRQTHTIDVEGPTEPVSSCSTT